MVWASPGVCTARLKRGGGTAQVGFTLPAVGRKRQGQKGREDLKGKDVVTGGTDCRKLWAGDGEESCWIF